MTRAAFVLAAIAVTAAAACTGRSMIPQTTAAAAAAKPQGDMPPAVRYPSSLLARLGDSIAVARATGATFRSEPGYKTIQGRRWESGGAEVHDDWTDIMIVQAGRANVITGGHLDNARLDSPGEHRAASIVGGRAQMVSAGDVMIIPAGTPHQSQLASGDTLRYLTIKVPR